MKEILILVLGWLLGLLGPRIVDSIKNKYHRRELAKAIKSEAKDLQFRVACMSYLLAKHCGVITREYIAWLNPVLSNYQGNEPAESIREFLLLLQKSTDSEFSAIVARGIAEEGVGLSLKNVKSSFIESNMAAFVNYPTGFQVCIHEFLNQLYILNQEIVTATTCHQMTFDSSMSEENHKTIKSELHNKYNIIHKMCRVVCEKLQNIISYNHERI